MSLSYLALITGAALSASVAQEAPPPEAAAAAQPAGQAETDAEDEDVTTVEEVVVTGARLRGSVESDIPPEITLDPADIRATGATTIAELLEALEPQTRSGRGRGEGRPVLLVNGRRVSGPREVHSVPSEAIERVEILPEEVALELGYRADQRVINFILRERFRATTVQARAGASTAGGRYSGELDGNFLRLRGDERLILEAEVERATPLFEDERNIRREPGQTPYDLIGNVTGLPYGGEIDPALSLLAGGPVTVAAVPGFGAGGPFTLADFVETAGYTRTGDLGAWRSLLPETESVEVGGTYTRPLNDYVVATLNARLEGSRSESFLGLPGASLTLPSTNPNSPFTRDVLVWRYFDRPDAMRRNADTVSGRLGAAFTGDWDDWRWSLTGGYDVTRSDTETGRGVDANALQAALTAGDPSVDPFGPGAAALLGPGPRDTAQSLTQSGELDFVANGDLFSVPAGDVSASFRAGFNAVSLDSESVRSGLLTERELSRTQGGVQGNLNIPIASTRNEVLAGLGNLTLNLNAAYDELSDFGGLVTYGYGLNWRPNRQWSVIASVTDEEGAPSIQQLNDPVISTPNVQVFDFATGQTVEVTRIEGGNPGLTADNRRVQRLGVTWRPLGEADVTLSANYVRTTVDNPISSFPTITPALEAAFPERFIRDSGGRLISIDTRPVNYDRSQTQQLRWGINYSRPIRRERPTGEGGPRRRGEGGPQGPGAHQGPEGGDGPRPEWRGGGEGGRFRGGGGRGGFGRFGGNPREGRLTFALYHTWNLQNEVVVRPGLPTLDLLNGDAVGAGGGQSEHQAELQSGYYLNGLGARFTADWRSDTFVAGGAPGGAGDLYFSDLATANLSLFADLGARRAWVRQHPWLRGGRVSLEVRNLFDARRGVTDAAGVTPISYQPDLLDAEGRTVTLRFRKLIF
ncbi:hypothetical protein Q0812_00800 [Brevundimonas sp. 2R-24]|uniref:TonB-dependent receptor n=1 Tax=Peiella sedimenti TaxID=3061083 RepID=A0ABT8SK00_9CAUL|nr:hypothetical protein [Caulobacteraceae bacterium XZ-24]